MNSTCHNFNFEGEASRFNLIANYLDKSAALIETLSDHNIKDKLKSCISQIEDLILQSPEWIYNNGIPGINIGMFGSFDGGWKEVLSVFANSNEHEYIEDMGIRVKSLLKLNENLQYLLLIRHESENIPNREFSNWLDCGIVVFKLENERSYKDALLSHKEFMSLRSQDCKRAPMILVGCRDKNYQESPEKKSMIFIESDCKDLGIDKYIEFDPKNKDDRLGFIENCTLFFKNTLKQTEIGENIDVKSEEMIEELNKECEWLMKFDCKRFLEEAKESEHVNNVLNNHFSDLRRKNLDLKEENKELEQKFENLKLNH